MESRTPIILLLMLPLAHLQFNEKAGPFEIIYHHIEECEDLGEGNLRFIFKTKRISRRTFTLDMDGVFGIPIDDDLKVSVSSAVLSNGGYRENFYSKNFSHICATGKMMLPKFLKKLGTALGHPERPCPIPKGNWTIRGLPLASNVGVPVFFYNDYRTRTIFFKNNKSNQHQVEDSSVAIVE